jgi:aspartyl/asparaginyl-tRNA synthetase
MIMIYALYKHQKSIWTCKRKWLHHSFTSMRTATKQNILHVRVISLILLRLYFFNFEWVLNHTPVFSSFVSSR